MNGADHLKFQISNFRFTDTNTLKPEPAEMPALPGIRDLRRKDGAGLKEGF